MKDVRDGKLPLWLRGVAVVQAGLASAFLVLWIDMAIRHDYWRSDFTAFYSGWRIILEGNGSHLYDRAVQSEYQARYVPERTAEGGLLAYNTSPHTALALAPLAGLPRWAAFGAWTVLQLGFLVLVLHFFLEWTHDWPAGERFLLIATILAFPPLFMTFQLGQFSLAALLCLVGFYRALRRHRDAAAATWLVLCTFKPQLVVVPAVTLLAARRWRAIAWSLALFGAWAAVTSAAFGWRCWLDFLDMTRHGAQQFGTAGIFPLRMYNCKGILTALLGSDQSMLINNLTAAALLMAMLITAWLWRGPWRPESPGFWSKAALSLQISFVCNPHFNPADALCLVLPAVLFLLYLRQTGRPWYAWAVFLLTWPWLFAVDCLILTDWPGRFRPFFLVMLGALAWIAWEHLRWDRHEMARVMTTKV